MPVPIRIILVLLAGLALGTFFFGGLWLTVRALPRSRRPAILMFGSFWGRTALVVAGFIWVIDRRWQSALICMLGFLIARLLLARYLVHQYLNSAAFASFFGQCDKFARILEHQKVVGDQEIKGLELRQRVERGGALAAPEVNHRGRICHPDES